VVLFAAASAWCGLASDMQQLILARALQGIGGALLVPGSLALISASFPEQLRGRAIGTWSGYTAITAAVGPLVGGYLIDHVSWRLAFLINLPLALVVVGLTLRYVPESRDRAAAPGLDWGGALLASAGLGCVVYGLIASPASGWLAAPVLGTLAAAVLLLAAFIVVEQRHPAPMLPLHLFRSRDFSGANLLTLLLYAALGGGLYFFPLNLIQVQGYSAVEAGAALLPFVLLMFALSRWSGGLVDRYGARRPLVIGPLIAGLGFAGLALPGIGGSYWATYFPAVLVLGLGMAVTVAPLTTTVMNALDSDLAGAASGVNNAVSRVAALLAIAVFGIVMQSGFDTRLGPELVARGVPAAQAAPLLAQHGKLAATVVSASAPPARQAQLRDAIGAAYVAGFRRVMWLSALLALGSAVCAWVWIAPRRLPV